MLDLSDGDASPRLLFSKLGLKDPFFGPVNSYTLSSFFPILPVSSVMSFSSTISNLAIDRMVLCFYNSLMRSVTFILLAVIVVMIFAPMTLFTPMAVNDGRSFLGNLDVCHSATPAIASNGEMPCVTASICIATPLLTESFNYSLQKVFLELILSSRNEQPPRS